MKLLSNLFEKGKKKSFRDWMAIGVICGLILLLVFFPSKGEEKGNDASLLGVETEKAEGNRSLADEVRLEELLGKIDRIGAVDVMITYENEATLYSSKQNEISGIVVVCLEEYSGETELLIHEVIQALFPVSAHKIKVVKGISSYEK